MTTRTAFLEVVTGDLGDPSPLNTCVNQGVASWAARSGLPYPNRTYSASDIERILGDNYGGPKSTAANVTGIAAAAQEGADGYAWIAAADAEPGDWLVWPNYDHISVLTDTPNGTLRSIGAGGPTGRVAYQPKSGGGNPVRYFIGAIRPPFEDAAATPPASGYRVGPVIRSGPDWSWAEPEGELAARVQRAMSARGRYNFEDGSPRPDDGEFGAYSRMGVQLTLDASDVFNGLIDGIPERGASYGVQEYAARFGDYLERGGVIDGAPRVLSWDCFALGLERP